MKREEHGFIKGVVVAVAELPATNLALEEALLWRPELADALLKRYASEGLLRLHVKLEEVEPRPESKNHFRWSSSSGSAQPLKTGTMCQAAIVVGSRRLISLIVPWATGL